MTPLTICLALGSPDILALAFTRRKGVRQFVKAFRVPKTEDGNEGGGWAGRIRAAAPELAKQSHSSCILLLPRHLYSIAHVETPSGTDDEIQSIVALEMEGRLPLDPADITYGWWNLTGTGSDRRLVEVYWTPTRMLTPLVESAREAGLDVAAIVPSAAVFRHMYCPAGANGKSQGNEIRRPVAFLDVSAQAFEFFAFDEEGRVAYSRGAEVGVATQGTTPPLGEDLAAEVSRTFKQFSVRVEETSRFHLLLGRSQGWTPGDGHTLGPFERAEQYAFQALGTRPDSLPVGADEAADFAPLVAAAQIASRDRAGRIQGNMLPGHITRSRERKRIRALTSHIVLLSLGIVLCVALNLWFYSRSMENQLRENRAEIERLTPVVAEVEAMEQRVASIRAQIDYVIPPLEALTQLNRLLQANRQALDGQYFDHLTYDADGKIRLGGHATNDILPWRFAEAIAATEQFQIVEKPVIVPRPYGDTRTIRFQIGLQALRETQSPDDGKESAP